MSTFRSGPRPLPQAPGRNMEQQEALWYEHEERMRPSYIQMPSRAQPQDGWERSFPQSPPGRSPGATSLASRNSHMTYDSLQRSPMVSPNTEHQRMAWPDQNSSASGARPSHLQTTPSRLRPSSMRPFDGDDARRAPKGSAFMHKGFLDILSLVNSPSNRSGGGAIKATLSKATGRLRKMSNTGQPLRDDFFERPSPQLTSVANAKVSTPVAGPRPPPSSPSIGSTGQQSQDSAYSAPQQGAIPGPRLQKKRISTQMVGSPRPDSFVHTAHASDADQAEELLRRWGIDGSGQPDDSSWSDRTKEAMRAQAQRNEAEALAEAKSALYGGSTIKGAPRELQKANSNQSITTPAYKASPGRDTAAPPDRAYQNGLPPSQDITAPQSPLSNDTTLSKRSIAPPAQVSQPPVQGTVLMAPGAGSRQETLPDYLQYKPKADAQGTTRLVDGLPGLEEEGNDNFKALLNRAKPPAPPARKDVVRNLAGEEMSLELAQNAGAAMRPSLATVEKSVAAKIYFENLYFGILKKPQARETRRAGLEAELAGLRISEEMKASIRAAWAANETEHLRDIRARVSANSFAKLKTIGHGAFGVVALVKERQSGQVFAMKQLRKADMLRKGQEGHIRAERDLMTSASASTLAKWIVKLIYSFQDNDHLYLIMEFMGGGDLLNLLIERDIFEEDFARFYVAEMILAIHEAHKFGYIHRDIKPDNFLFTSDGHIKLADFGLCQSFHWAHDGAYYEQQRKQLLKRHGIDLEDAQRAGRDRANSRAAGVASSTKANAALSDKELEKLMSDRNKDGTPQTHVLTWREKNKKKLAFSVVGTNNYMAPEVLRGLGYDQSCDWWSLGVIVFEMLYGYPPFVSKSRHMTRQKILNWKQTLKFPPKPKVSRDAQDFIRKLICEREDRLGSVATASVSRPNSLMQGSRQRSGFNAAGANSNDSAGVNQGLTDGVDDIMAHNWFRGVDWRSIHKSPAPFVPDLSHAADTKHFEDDIEDAPLPAPGAAEAIKNGLPPPVEEARDPMLRDKEQGAQLLEMRKQLAFVGYTFKSPKVFDPRTQLTDSKIRTVEQMAAARTDKPEEADVADAMGSTLQPPLTQSRLRSMSM